MKIKDILKEISFNTSAAAISGDEGISDHSPRFNIKQSCSFKNAQIYAAYNTKNLIYA